MAIAFIFVITVIVFLLLALSFIIKLYILAMVSSMGIIIIGITTLASGIQGIDNVLTLGLGVICVSYGSYIFVNGSVQELSQYHTSGIEW